MRLISRFHDYYDGCQRADREPTPVWTRELSMRVVRDGQLREIAELGAPGRAVREAQITHGLSLCPTLVAVAGQAWTLYTARAWMVPSSPTDLDAFVPYWTVEAIVAGCRAAHDVRYGGRPPARRSRSDNVSDLDRWTESPQVGVHPNDPGRARMWLGQTFEVPAEIHRRLGAPVFLLRHAQQVAEHVIQVFTNPPLRGLGFSAVLDVPSIWQKIDTYLGNEMAVQVDPLPLSDELRRDAHGFDDTSFKQPAPGERKARRAARRGVS